MTRRKLRRAHYASLTLGGLALTSIASAEPHVHPGAMCERLSGGTINYTEDASLYNSNTSSDQNLILICPVVRPNSVSGVTSGVVRVHDQSATEAVSCSLRCRDTASSAFFSSNGDTGAVANTGNYQAITFGAVSDYDSGACYMRCDIPDVDVATSYLISYSIMFANP